MNTLTIDSLELKGKKVLVRCDFNVPLDENLKIRDDKRIVDALPTIKKIIYDGGKLILMSHFGRPKGKVVPEMSLKPVADRLSELLGKKVILAPDCIGDEVKDLVSKMNDGDVVLLENLRFHEEEEAGNEEFAAKLAELGEIYISDAFGVCHRAHASVSIIAKYFDKVASGYLLKNEIEYIGGAMKNPQRPLAAILAGNKISGKIDVIMKLIDISDKIFIGGGIANTMLLAKGIEVGKSLVEADKVDIAREILKKAEIKGTKILLPLDMLCGKEFKNETELKYFDTDKQEKDWIAMGIGEKTVLNYKEELADCKTLIWNGPMSVFEFENFAKETFEIAEIIADYTQNNGLISIIGGGDTAAAVKIAGLDDKYSHVSTGGGAAMEYMEGKKLPGIACLSTKGFDPNRRFLIAGNWKMNKTPRESIKFAKDLEKVMINDDNVEIMVAPVFNSIYPVYSELKKTHIDIGSQDVFWENSGAYTGEVSVKMLKLSGVKYCIIGHSERRQYFGETDETVNKKIKAVLKEGLVPVICVGEMLEQREKGIEKQIVKDQIEGAFAGIELNDYLNVVIAYEPVWAIGTGKTATPEQAQEMHAFIRSILKDIYGNEFSQATRILYGGSLNVQNAKDLLSRPDIDGGLIGGASLKKDDFSKIVEIAKEI
ncbi:MAG: triose-phosphate isomerase [Candidatus Delongbacteria bacterium]|nr:triose-phosphate isomerase [Candidatus Delongbacteria bacterium]MCG2759932.1 triose-phosphate isomerase [Candidatus Delongbacteria bacterium]